MSEASPTALLQASFHCKPCQHRFEAAPVRIEDLPEDTWHPWRYFAPCPKCGAEASQAAWERALLKAWRRATGPRTPEGTASTAKNLEGHPTAEEALRTRFNAMKHGLSAKVATYFPAKPDKYARCSSCEVDRQWCAAQPACVKQQEIFLLHHAAFESRNPKHLSSIYANLQAAVFALVQEIVTTIITDGAKISVPEYYTDPAGQLVVATYVDEQGQRRIIHNIESHPLFRPLSELLSRNGLSLSDMGMTTKVMDEDEEAMGRMKTVADERTAVEHFSRQTAESMEALRGMMERASNNRRRDPILIEHEQQG
ncbi:MAG: hypothetical protein AB7P08_17335 [Burkholderiales bacterium]